MDTYLWGAGVAPGVAEAWLPGGCRVRAGPAVGASDRGGRSLPTIPTGKKGWGIGFVLLVAQQKLVLTISILALTLGSKSCYF
jgi:hypothetical protein